MADVQLEHGYVKIANRLFEAIIEARFSGRQTAIVLTLIRLTYGWRRRSVRLSELELAEFCNATSGDSRRAGGAFRDDLQELLRERVVVRVDVVTDDRKRGLFAWSLNKDFAEWGRFSQAASGLAARWNPKLKSATADDGAIAEELARNQATSTGASGLNPGHMDEDEWPDSGPLEGEKWTDTGPHSGLTPGHIVARYRATSRENNVATKGVTTPERQGKTEKDRKAESHARGRAREGPAACSLSLAELLAPVSPAVRDFFDRFYAQADPARQHDVADQLHRLTGGFAVEDADGNAAKAYTPGRLDAKCRDVVTVRDPDKAILVLLRKLGDTSDGVVDDLYERERQALADDARAGAERIRLADQWAAENPDRATELHARIELEIPGSATSPFIAQARRWAFVAAAAREAEAAPEPADAP